MSKVGAVDTAGAEKAAVDCRSGVGPWELAACASNRWCSNSLFLQYLSELLGHLTSEAIAGLVAGTSLCAWDHLRLEDLVLFTELLGAEVRLPLPILPRKTALPRHSVGCVGIPTSSGRPGIPTLLLSLDLYNKSESQAGKAGWTVGHGQGIKR